MAVLCSNGEHRGPDGAPFEIVDGARRIDIPALSVKWGDQDLRGDWSGSYVFCSFGCLEERAGDWAAVHDSHVLQEGQSPDVAGS